VSRTARRMLHVARTLRAPIALLLVYECSRLVFFFLSRRHGLLQGQSVVNVGTLLFGVWLLALRFAVLFCLPFAVVHRVVKRLGSGEPRH